MVEESFDDKDVDVEKEVYKISSVMKIIWPLSKFGFYNQLWQDQTLQSSVFYMEIRSSINGIFRYYCQEAMIF